METIRLSRMERPREDITGGIRESGKDRQQVEK